MQWSKTEWYIFVFAAFTMSLIYFVAFDKNLGAVFGGANSLLSKIMGQNAAGNFQAPFGP